VAVQQQQAANAGAVVGQTVAYSQTHFTEISTGPLPPPSMLAEYDRIIPGAAERILNLAEQQTKHRIELEKSAIRSEISRSWTGLWMGLIVSLAACSLPLWPHPLREQLLPLHLSSLLQASLCMEHLLVGRSAIARLSR